MRFFWVLILAGLTSCAGLAAPASDALRSYATTSPLGRRLTAPAADAPTEKLLRLSPIVGFSLTRAQSDVQVPSPGTVDIDQDAPLYGGSALIRLGDRLELGGRLLFVKGVADTKVETTTQRILGFGNFDRLGYDAVLRYYLADERVGDARGFLQASLGGGKIKFDGNGASDPTFVRVGLGGGLSADFSDTLSLEFGVEFGWAQWNDDAPGLDFEELDMRAMAAFAIRL